MQQQTVSIIGGGSWATALAKIISQNVPHLNWFIYEQDIIDHIKKHKHLIKVGGNTGLILKSLLPVLAKYLKSKNKNESIREDVHGSDLSG